MASRDALPIPECVVGALDATAAAEALGDVAPAVAERLCHATGGNPLALAEAARTLTPRQRAGTEPLPDPLSVGDDLFDRQIADLPDAARRALTIAAADGSASRSSPSRHGARDLRTDPGRSGTRRDQRTPQGAR